MSPGANIVPKKRASLYILWIMTPDSSKHKPSSVRYLLGQLKALGFSQRAVGEKVGKCSKALSNHATGKAVPDYPLQYTLEELLKAERRRAAQ